MEKRDVAYLIFMFLLLVAIFAVAFYNEKVIGKLGKGITSTTTLASVTETELNANESNESLESLQSPSPGQSEGQSEESSQAEAGPSRSILTNSTSGTYANLTIWDETDLGMPYVNGYGFVYANETIKFFANYTDSVNGQPISGSCNISFDDSQDNPMSYNTTSKLYEYVRVANWSGSGIFNITYNISCSASGLYDWLNLSDTATIKDKKIVCDITSDNTCYITTGQSILKPTTITSQDIGAANLYIHTTGSINSTPGSASITINLTGNLTIANGGRIYTPAGSYNSGNITILADVVTIYGPNGAIESYGAGGGWQAGTIAINASKLELYGVLRAQGLNCTYNYCSGGNGNTINVNAMNVFLYSGSQIISSGGNGGYSSNYGGNGGSITINSTNITISNVTIDSHGGLGDHGGSGGSISLNSTNISISNVTINTYGGYGNYGGAGGNISLNSTNISISNVTINAYGGNSANYLAGRGGSITINSTNISISNVTINSYGGSSTYDYGGSGGSISLNSTNISISNVTINSYGGLARYSGGAGGSISLNSANINFSNVMINAYGGNSSLLSGGSGGSISLNSTNISLSNVTINSYGGIGYGLYPGAGGNGGNVIITALNDLPIYNLTVQAWGGGGWNKGYAGTVNLTSPTNLYIDNSTINVGSPDPSKVGRVNIKRQCGYDRVNYLPNASVVSYYLYNGTESEASGFGGGDAIADSCDNCKYVFNPDQYDSDGDGWGDGCDTHIEAYINEQPDMLVDVEDQPIRFSFLYKTDSGGLVPNDAVSIFNVSIGSESFTCYTNNCSGTVSTSYPLASIVPVFSFANSSYFDNNPYNAATLEANITIRNITLTIIPPSVIAANTLVGFSGYVYYDNSTPVDQANVSIYSDGSFKGSNLTNASGYYSITTSFADAELGQHTLKVNATRYGVVGENSTLITVIAAGQITNITIQGQNATLYPSVDVDDGVVNISAVFATTGGTPVLADWNVTIQEKQIKKTCSGVSQCNVSFELGEGKELPIGTYTIKFEALNSTLSMYASKTQILYVTDLWFNLTLLSDHLLQNQSANVSGRAYYAHNGSAFANKNVSVYEDGIFKKNVTTNATGHFVYSFNASDEVGNHTLKFNASDADMIYGERTIVYGVYYNTSTGINWSYNASSGLLSITANYTNISNGALISGNFVINVTSLSGLSPASSQKYCYGVAICNVDFSVGQGQGRDVRGGNVVIKAIAENESAFYNASSASLATYLEEPTSTALLIGESKVIRDKGVGQEYRTNITLNITNTGFGTIYNVTLGIQQIIPTNYNYSVVNREEFCGNLSRLQSCLKNFTVVIGADVEKDNNASFVWNASWLNNDGSRNNTITITTIGIGGIARIESVANASYEMQHGTTQTFYIRVNSTGNDDVINLSLSLTAITINSSWVNVVWNGTGTQTLLKLCYKTGCPTYDFIKLTIAIPLYTDAAVYSGTIMVKTSNANNLSIPLYITVLPNGTWQWLAPSYVEIGYGGGTKPITNVTITNRGNIALNFTISYSGNITNEFFFTAAGNQQAFLIQKGTSANLTLFYNPTLISKEQEKLYSLNITFSNSSATPPVNSTLIYVRVRNLPPVISNVVLTDISGRHYVNIPMTITASVDNDDGISNINWTWLELGLPNRSIVRVEYSYYKDRPEFHFTPQLVGRYSFTIYANDTSGNVGNYSGSFDVVYDTWKPSIIAIAMPSFVEVGQPLLVLMNASDDLRLDKARITVKDLANNTLADLLMDENLSADRRQGNYSYEASFGEGDYIVSITVNDTSNNKASISKFFRVYHNVSVSGNLNDKNQSANLSLCLPDYLKDYLKDYAMCYQNITLPSAYDVVLYSGMAKLVLNINNTIFVTFDDVNVTELSSDFVKIKRLPTTFTIAPTYVTIDGVAIEASPTFNFSRAEIKFVFNPNDVLIPAFLRIFKCANFTFEAEVCENVTNWTEISSSVVGPSVSAIVYNLSGFLLAEDRSAIIERGGGGGGGRAAPAGGGGGGISWSELERLKSELIKALGRVENLELDVNTISKELYPGESTATDITITNLANISQVFDVTVSGEIADMVNVNINRLEIPAKDQRKLRVAIAVPSDKKPGLYVGSVLISGATRLLIPIELRVLEPKEKMLDLRLTPIDVQVSPGSTLRVQADVFNLGVGGGRVDVNLLVEVVDPKLLQVLFKKQETFAVETSVSKIFTFDIPKDMQTGRYIIRGTANYEIKGVQQKASALSYFVVGIPWYKRTLLGIPIWVILAGVMFIILNLVSLEIYEKRREAKKRYRVPVEFHLLPQPTERAAFVGHIAETKTRAFLDLDQLKMHTIISGSTGSGKTIAAQVICEEALMKNVAVIVFDPSAQWTGFLRKCKEKYMLKHYKEFAMKLEDARAFNGNIHQVTDPRQVLDISKYIVPGEIHIFTLNKLKPRELDFFVASSIKQIFDMNPKESRELKLLLVYDEVHRLLPKFGGAGEGFIQLERGCREFRKWGIGLLLISQVTADFVGAIKANIMTEIQLRTREDSDLDRIKLKYGEDMLKAVVKAAIGTGMVVNPEYNRGRPYFISFRPILHQVTRLDDEELEKYARYNERVEQLEYNIEQIAKKKDVFDLKIELKLALDKIKAGNWAMADIYLEGLEQRVRNEMAKLGIKEKKKEKKYVTVEEIKREVERAKKEREIYVKRLAMEAREEKKIADVFEKVSAAYSNVKEQLVAARKAGANVKDEELKLASIAGDLSVARAYKDKAKAEKILKMLNELKKNIEKKMKTKEKEKGGGK